MSDPKTIHDTFVIDRTYPASPARVFAAFADPEIKKRWFLIDKEMAETVSYENDFRVGGKETARYRFEDKSPGGSKAGTIMGNDSVYMDIVPDERIVTSYAMLIGDQRVSTSLTTIELVPEGDGTRLVFTEQAVYFDRTKGPHMAGLRKQGTEQLLVKLGKVIA